jgi:hypothetical protein
MAIIEPMLQPSSLPFSKGMNMLIKFGRGPNLATSTFPKVNTSFRLVFAGKRRVRSQLIDMFNVGLAEDMDHLLDRYQDLTGNSDFFGQYQGGWTVESHLVFLMHQKYNICVADSPLIWADAVREEFRCAGITGCRSQQPMPIQQFWTDLSGKLVHREGS